MLVAKRNISFTAGHWHSRQPAPEPDPVEPPCSRGRLRRGCVNARAVAMIGCLRRSRTSCGAAPFESSKPNAKSNCKSKYPRPAMPAHLRAAAASRQKTSPALRCRIYQTAPAGPKAGVGKHIAPRRPQQSDRPDIRHGNPIFSLGPTGQLRNTTCNLRSAKPRHRMQFHP